MSERLEWARVAAEWLGSDRAVAYATLVETEGSAPLEVGASMLIDATGAVEGSVTGGCVEGAVVEEALLVLACAPARTSTYGILDELAGSVGLTCGGTVHIFIRELRGAARTATLAMLEAMLAARCAGVATLLDGPNAGSTIGLVELETSGSFGATELLDRNVREDLRGLVEHGVTTTVRYGEDGARAGSSVRVLMQTFAAPRRLLVFGANDFSAALVALAAQAGYAVTICDAREPFLASPRFSRAAETIVAWPHEVLATSDLGPRDAIVVMTHDPKFDEPAILGALATDVGYVGALGSRRTVQARTQRLAAAGATPDDLARIFAPAGLDIGAATPGETAVAILAEIVAQRSGRGGGSLRDGESAIRPRPSFTSVRPR